MNIEKILKLHLERAFESWQESKMEAYFYNEGYDDAQLEQNCYYTLAMACEDVGIKLSEEEKEAIKKPLIKKWDEIKKRRVEEEELKRKYFREVVVPHAKSFEKDVENAKTGIEAKCLEGDFYNFLRISADILDMKPVELEEMLNDVL